LCRRAALLSRCDLMTEMVYEFPEMQGIMGRYQALRDGEPQELALAMDEFYMPRFSGDRLPQTPTGIAISLAERIDTLAGIFSIGLKPTGDKDPFALRRAALGALRILREHRLELDLPDLLSEACKSYASGDRQAELIAQVLEFLIERLRGIYHELGVGHTLFESVQRIKPGSITDFDRRIQAVQAFQELDEAEALAAANKRIGNILKKANRPENSKIDETLFEHDEERQLHQLLMRKQQQIAPLVERHQYKEALQQLAEMRDPVDSFFDKVMVMAEQPDVRNNRLNLLLEIQRLFLQVADISALQG